MARMRRRVIPLRDLQRALHVHCGRDDVCCDHGNNSRQGAPVRGQIQRPPIPGRIFDVPDFVAKSRLRVGDNVRAAGIVMIVPR